MAQIVQPALTIAIPTYNRPEKVKSQIRLLLPQLNEKVVLVVYDNCSDIPIKEYFSDEELQKFTLIRNRVNVGADANIARCFENCTTKWLWTLSDDDLVKENAVEIVFNEIEVNQEAVFVNFCVGLSFETRGFDELVAEFKSETVFSSSFTMSGCLYNMSKLQSSLQNYYSTLSSMMGTTILVLKYAQIHKEAVCRFVNLTPIGRFNDTVGWNYSVFIRRTRLFIESFGGTRNRHFNKTLFLGCHLINYSLISLDRKESKVSYEEKWRLLWVALKNQGILNGLMYCPKVIFMVFIRLLFQHKYLSWLKRILR